MSKIRLTYDRISEYLKGLLSSRERHDLEREMMQDPFDEEAFEGLSRLKGEELDADFDALTNQLDNRIRKGSKFRIVPLLRIAAAILIIVGTGAVLYNALKTPEPQLITQEVSKLEKAPAPETALPSMPETGENKIETITTEQHNEGIRQPEGKKETETSEQIVQSVEEIAENQARAAPSEKSAEARIPELSEADAAAASRSDSDLSQTRYITGRVLGVNRQALSGVTVMEEGTSQGTVTDANGNFSLRVRDTRSKVELSYAGYRSMELPTGEIAGKEITLDEEQIALNELIVLNYGTRKESEPYKYKAARTADSGLTSGTEVYSRPIPPGGTMKHFETWVEDRIDTLVLKELLPGKYKIRVKLTVNKDGTISNISVPNDVPLVISDEYKRAVSLSERWQPTMAGNLPVDSDIIIEFYLTVK